MECVELAPAVERGLWNESGSKLHALHTLRAVRLRVAGRGGIVDFQAAERSPFVRPADWKSAIQQVGNLRYVAAGGDKGRGSRLRFFLAFSAGEDCAAGDAGIVAEFGGDNF